MECKNEACGKDIPIDIVMWPAQTGHANPKRVQNDHPFAVARCPHCHQLNQVTNMPGGGTWTERIVPEAVSVQPEPADESAEES